MKMARLSHILQLAVRLSDEIEGIYKLLEMKFYEGWYALY